MGIHIRGKELKLGYYIEIKRWMELETNKVVLSISMIDKLLEWNCCMMNG